MERLTSDLLAARDENAMLREACDERLRVIERLAGADSSLDE